MNQVTKEDVVIRAAGAIRRGALAITSNRAMLSKIFMTFVLVPAWSHKKAVLIRIRGSEPGVWTLIDHSARGSGKTQKREKGMFCFQSEARRAERI